MNRYRKNLGDWGEQLAVKYLRKLGYYILEKNWRSREGEIDLIAIDDKTFVFIEVKTRKTATYGYPVESITNRKQEKMIKCIQKYLSQHHGLQHYQIRIDIILIKLDKKGKKARLQHLVNPVENCPD